MYDLIVVGAGTAGSIAAQAASGQGFKVCLIDQKEKKSIGDKTCGDAVGKHHFDRLKIPPPKGDELANKIRGVDVFSPDLKTVFRLKGESLHGFMLNRLEFGQRLLNDALDQDVVFFDKTTALEPIFKNESVCGVKVRNRQKNKFLEIFGRVIIDASGMSSVLRRKMPQHWKIDTNIQNKDIEVCYREIRGLSENIESPEYCRIYLSQKISFGGYYWIFPKGNSTVNVGLGLQMINGALNPRRQLYAHILSKDPFIESKKSKGSGGIVSTRRPLDCMVGNGILMVGDSACQPNPIHGGGIGPSMMAGKLAAEIICKAIEEEDVSQKQLWPYNVKYMRGYGGKAAALDIFRLFLQKCSDEDLNYGMAHRLVKEKDILYAAMGEDLKLNISDKAKRVFRGINKLSFLKTLYVTSKKMKEIKMLYKNYPIHIEDHELWVKRVERIISEIRTI
jgi:geranylgeranyl reductase family protein